MKAVVVSYLPFSSYVRRKLESAGIKEIVSYFKHKNAWKSYKDILEVCDKEEADACVIIANWHTAINLLANGVGNVFVLSDVQHNRKGEITDCSITHIYGTIDIKEID